MNPVDAWVSGLLFPLALWILLSGLDDFILDLACLYQWASDRFFKRGRVGAPTEGDLQKVRQKRIAVFVPLWREASIIGKMMEHNIAASKYRNHDFFLTLKFPTNSMLPTPSPPFV